MRIALGTRALQLERLARLELEHAPWREAFLVAIPPLEVLTEALVLWEHGAWIGSAPRAMTGLL